MDLLAHYLQVPRGPKILTAARWFERVAQRDPDEGRRLLAGELATVLRHQYVAWIDAELSPELEAAMEAHRQRPDLEAREDAMRELAAQEARRADARAGLADTHLAATLRGIARWNLGRVAVRKEAS